LKENEPTLSIEGAVVTHNIIVVVVHVCPMWKIVNEEWLQLLMGRKFEI
jgi:hypothetical protein